MRRDLTQGSLIKNMFMFAIPFFLSYFLQTLYGMADLFIVGQYNGASSISAVSIGSQVTHMMTVIFVGLSTGSSVLIGRYVGAKQENEMNKTIAHSIVLFCLIAIVSTIILYLNTSLFVSLLNTPKEAIKETIQYLHICFLGVPFIIAYNVIASTLRGMGDSKSPLYFIIIACIFNIVLDYYFIGTMHMHALGAALGTVISQAVSVVVSVIYLIKNKIIHLNKDAFHIEKQRVKQIIKIGLPVSLQDGFIQISFLIITLIANTRGLKISASVGIVEKIIGFLFLVPSSMMSTISTIVSQSIGANREDIAIHTLSLGIKICVIFGLLIIGIVELFTAPIISLFTYDKEIILLSVQYLQSYVVDVLIASIHFCFSGYFVAKGYSFLSFIHNFISIITLRVPGAYFASVYFENTLFPMGMAAPLGSLLQVFICIGMFYFIFYKKIMPNNRHYLKN